MIYGSYNTFSYLKPSGWFQRIFHFLGTYQSLDLKQQLECGIGAIDINLTFTESNFPASDEVSKYVVLNGYNTHLDIYQFVNRLLNDLKLYRKTLKFYVRITLDEPDYYEYIDTSNDIIRQMQIIKIEPKKNIELFNKFCNYFMMHKPETIHLIGGTNIQDTQIYNFIDTSSIKCIECNDIISWTDEKSSLLEKLSPKRYAKNNNKKYYDMKQHFDDNKIYFFGHVTNIR